MFRKLGNRYTKSKMSCENISLRRFKSMFGVTPKVCSVVWNEIKDQAPPAAQPIHILWCLSFLKEYSTEHNRRAIFKADEKTMRFWTWTFVKLIANLDVVRFTKILRSILLCISCLPLTFHRFVGKVDAKVPLFGKHVFVHWMASIYQSRNLHHFPLNGIVTNFVVLESDTK